MEVEELSQNSSCQLPYNQCFVVEVGGLIGGSFANKRCLFHGPGLGSWKGPFILAQSQGIHRQSTSRDWVEAPFRKFAAVFLLKGIHLTTTWLFDDKDVSSKF
jgi:hypothetical protein